MAHKVTGAAPLPIFFGLDLDPTRLRSLLPSCTWEDGAEADTWMDSAVRQHFPLAANSAAFAGECNQTSFIQERGGEGLEPRPRPPALKAAAASYTQQKRNPETLPEQSLMSLQVLEEIFLPFKFLPLLANITCLTPLHEFEKISAPLYSLQHSLL